ncbi:MAG: indole-3-glycerol phosphate synthase TrpC [Dehalococcoidia bacterium]|nr:indole-3-glycerol phosphate synthase TrpC [Dehalococcoidia bacterium]
MAEATRTTGTILDRIVADRRLRLAEDRRATPEAALAERRAALLGVPVDFARRLIEGRRATPAGARLRLIAEVKRASPSRGVFAPDLDAAAQAGEYAAAGAAAVSVLTEPAFFHGSIADLRAARAAFDADPDRPALLRKDFVFDRYQVLEAAAHGADALLLITALLTAPALTELIAFAREQGLEPLVEVHDAPELEHALRCGARVVGFNNRDLRTFAEDLGTTERLAPLAPAGTVLVAESAIKSAQDARRMAAAGVHALLVGEALVTTGDVRGKARELMLVDNTDASNDTDRNQQRRRA